MTDESSAWVGAKGDFEAGGGRLLPYEAWAPDALEARAASLGHEIPDGHADLLALLRGQRNTDDGSVP